MASSSGPHHQQKRRTLINYNWKPGQEIMSQIQDTTVLRNATLSKKRAFVETMGIGLASTDMPIPEMLGDG
jgi:hypothetical protein